MRDKIGTTEVNSKLIKLLSFDKRRATFYLSPSYQSVKQDFRNSVSLKSLIFSLVDKKKWHKA